MLSRVRGCVAPAAAGAASGRARAWHNGASRASWLRGTPRQRRGAREALPPPRRRAAARPTSSKLSTRHGAEIDAHTCGNPLSTRTLSPSSTRLQGPRPAERGPRPGQRFDRAGRPFDLSARRLKRRFDPAVPSRLGWSEQGLRWCRGRARRGAGRRTRVGGPDESHYGRYLDRASAAAIDRMGCGGFVEHRVPIQFFSREPLRTSGVHPVTCPPAGPCQLRAIRR
jgi:hypothetical protein